MATFNKIRKTSSSFEFSKIFRMSVYTESYILEKLKKELEAEHVEVRVNSPKVRFNSPKVRVNSPKASVNSPKVRVNSP